MTHMARLSCILAIVLAVVLVGTLADVFCLASSSLFAGFVLGLLVEGIALRCKT